MKTLTEEEKEKIRQEIRLEHPELAKGMDRTAAICAMIAEETAAYWAKHPEEAAARERKIEQKMAEMARKRGEI